MTKPGSGYLVLMALVILVGAGFLLIQLNNANTEAREARADVQDKAERISLLEDANAGFQEANVDLKRSNADFERANQDLRSSLTTAQDHLASSRSQNSDLRASLEGAQRDNGELRIEADRLRAENADLQRYQQDVYSISGSITQLQAQAEGLRIEIETLKEQRRPLILGRGNTSGGGFACTGSMYPALTCLDRMTWLTDFDPADIVVGAIISFDPNCWERQPNGRDTAHRVMDIAVENGVYYFWPAGDTNPEPDGCWVHQDNVDGYLIAIEKNVVPENSYLQSQVIAAKVAWLVAVDAYERLAIRHCGTTDVRNCYFGQFYGEALAAYELTEETLRYYDCWYRNAEDSEYPGHIPYSCAS